MAKRRPLRPVPPIAALLGVTFLVGATAAFVAMPLSGTATAAENGAEPAAQTDAHPMAGLIWDVAASEALTVEELAARLDGADIAILGEVHDNSVHHQRQAAMVAAVEPAGIAFEMVPEASERGIAVFLESGGTRAEIGPAIGWERLGWPDWDFYRPVFEAAPDAVITGGAVAKRLLSQAMRTGAAEAYGEGAVLAVLSEDLPAELDAAMRAEMMSSHCDMLPAEMAGPMVEAQRLRDARFADATLRARHLGQSGQAVLITGNGHARTDHGVPAILARVAPDLDVVSVGQVELADDALTPADYAEAGQLPYDIVWFSGGVADRGDPCDAFRRR